MVEGKSFRVRAGIVQEGVRNERWWGQSVANSSLPAIPCIREEYRENLTS